MAPPSVQDTPSCPEVPLEVVTPVGAGGGPPTTFDAEAEEAGLVPPGFVAVTVTVYDVPFVRPVMLQDVVADVHVKPPGEAVAV